MTAKDHLKSPSEIIALEAIAQSSAQPMTERQQIGFDLIRRSIDNGLLNPAGVIVIGGQFDLDAESPAILAFIADANVNKETIKPPTLRDGTKDKHEGMYLTGNR